MIKPGFIQRHHLWTAAQKEASEQITAIIKERDILLIRTAWEDQHGILRSKSLLPQALDSALENFPKSLSYQVRMHTCNKIYLCRLG